MHVDTHKPCPVCGKPFETETPRNRNSLTGLEMHIQEKRDEAHRQYREKRTFELHSITCDCEKCKPQEIPTMSERVRG